MQFKYQSFEIELQLESIMEIFTKLFVCFLIAIGIQWTGACVREYYFQNNFYQFFVFFLKIIICFVVFQDQYGVRIKTTENCGGAKQVMKIDTNSSMSLSEDCVLSFFFVARLLDLKQLIRYDSVFVIKKTRNE